MSNGGLSGVMIWTEAEIFGAVGSGSGSGWGSGPAEQLSRPPYSEKPHVQGAVKTSFQGVREANGLFSD